MNITKGIKAKAQKVVIYGPEGVGKSSLAAQFPNPLFIDTEGSTDNMDVARLDKPTSWTMLINQISWIKANPTVCQTLIIDTADWAERLCIESVLAQHNKKGIEDFGYGNGYTYVAEEFGRFLNKLQDLIDIGINVVLTAHAQIRKFEQPDEMGAYDRYELKLGKKTTGQTAPLTKEWADMILFCNYKTHVIATDDKGKKHKAQGGTRVMYTEHHPAWDAKNRHGLPFELPLDYNGIRHIFDKQQTQTVQPVTPPPVQQATVTPQAQAVQQTQPLPKVVTSNPTPYQETDEFQRIANETFDAIEEEQMALFSSDIPIALRDLMRTNGVTSAEIERAVAEKGFYPEGTPIKNYDPGFVEGVLVGAWEQVFEHIKKDRELPF